MSVPYSLEKFLEQRLGLEATDEVYDTADIEVIQKDLHRLAGLFREIHLARSYHATMPEKKAEAGKWADACELKANEILKGFEERFHLGFLDDREHLMALIFELDRLNFMDLELDIAYDQLNGEEAQEAPAADTETEEWISAIEAKKIVLHRYLNRYFGINLG